MRRNIIVLMLVFSLKSAIAQQSSIQPLKIGDKLPPVFVQYLSGDRIKSVPLEFFYRSKFLIIDFWATYCSSCIYAIAEADSIRKIFNDKLIVLPISNQDAGKVKKFIATNKVLSKLDLSFVVNDSILSEKYFKFKMIPHEVWINSKGIICAITYPDELTYENILRFVNNKPLHISEKNDDITFNMFERMSVETNEFLYRSVLTKAKPGVEGVTVSAKITFKEGEQLERYLGTNRSILQLFYTAFSNANDPMINYNRIELHIKDSFLLSPFFENYPYDRKKNMPNLYCYELVLPDKVPENTFWSSVFNDLNRFFPFKATVEKRKKLAWVIINKNREKKLAVNHPKIPETVWKGGYIVGGKNITMPFLVNYLNWTMDSLPVIDGSNFEAPFDIILDAKNNGVNRFMDTAMIIESLRKAGFDMVKKEREVEILVIRQNEK